jgi:phosphoribosylaminoimidazole (AIR) synthetase
MNSKISVKVSESGLSFLQKLKTNRRKADIDKEDLAYWKLIEVIAKYFKLNNDEYLKVVNMGWNKNV